MSCSRRSRLHNANQCITNMRIAKRSSEWPIVSEFSLLSDSWGDSFRKSASFEIERP